jgi:hypothetical protein
MAEPDTNEIDWLLLPMRSVGLAVLLTMSLALPITPTLLADERPSPIAPYRYTSPSSGPLDSLEQQKALSYRNDLKAQQRLQQLDRKSSASTASELRSQGDLNRETSRIDQMLQQ